MSSLIKQLHSRKIDHSKVHFDGGHINERAKERNFTKKWIIDTVFNEKMLFYCPGNREGSFETYYHAPDHIAEPFVRIVFFENEGQLYAGTIYSRREVPYWKRKYSK